jgi:hypothetical protein
MRITVIGAGPAGLTAAKQALANGHDVTVYEATGDVGGIWNPAAGGAYDGVRMQSSRMSFPFSDFAPAFDDDFPTLRQIHGYLRDYAEHFGVLPLIRFHQPVTGVSKRDGEWSVTARHAGSAVTDRTDAVLVATGELWHPRMPAAAPDPRAGVQVLSAKDYRRPSQLRGRRVLVVGGGVSGADISSELVGEAAAVDWSVRRRALFLPRDCGGVYNDGLFSYIGRVAVEEMPYRDWLAWLARLMPEYMAMYAATGLLPTDGFHHAVHVNEKIIPQVHRGTVRVRPAFARFADDGSVVFADGGREHYDTVLFCLGYGMPDYGFIADFRREDLYEHHFYRHDPTLAVINTPVDTEAFGTACPYFEAIAGWALAVLSGKVSLPDPATMADWCQQHMSDLADRRHFDCWLETVRIGLASGELPDPATSFGEYWNLVASIVTPSNLRAAGVVRHAAPGDDLFDLAALRIRVLAALPTRARDALIASDQISADEYAAAAAVPRARAIEPWLPYRMRA